MKRSKYNHIKQSRKIFVGGLPPETTKLSLSRFFEKYGEVEYSIVMTDKHTNRPRGFGFVIFKNLVSVENALNDSWNHFINGKWVECKKANSKEQCKEGRVESEIETNGSSNDSTLSTDIVSTSMPFTQKSKPLDNFVYVNSIDDNNQYVQKQMEDYYRFKFSFDSLSH